jgi:hypothetical protein
MPHSIFDFGFPVASFVVVVYDWGEQRSVRNIISVTILLVLSFEKEVMTN